MNGCLAGAVCALALSCCLLSPLRLAPTAPSRKDVLKLASRVADWQLERMGATHGVTKYAEETANPRSWQQGAFWVGMTHLADVTGEKRFADAIIAMGKANQWKPGKRTLSRRRSRDRAELSVGGAPWRGRARPSRRCAPPSIRSSPIRRSIT